MGLLQAPSRIMRPNHLRDSDNASSATLLFARRIDVFAPSENPNGIPSQSPGLRGTSYPGSLSVEPSQPQRGCGQSIPVLAPDLGHNAVGVVSISERAPKVGVGRQPWAGGLNPFGIVRAHILALCAGRSFKNPPPAQPATGNAKSQLFLNEPLRACFENGWRGRPAATRPPRSATRRPELRRATLRKGDTVWLEPFLPFRPASRRTAQAGRLCYQQTIF